MNYDIVVVGGGHAGIEAAYIASKKNLSILLVTGNLDMIGQMSCNPSIGGVSKGNLVREVDALGGVMGKVIDQCGIHFKMLNRSKGVAVWGNRAQADKERYRKTVRKELESRERITFLQGYVKRVVCSGDSVSAVLMDSGETVFCRAIILTMGTFLNGVIHIGLTSFSGGRIGEPPSTGLTESLNELGIKSGRLKTGTSPRIDGRRIDYSKFEKQSGDDDPWAFSYSTEKQVANSVCCYIGRTNHLTHEHILNSLDRSPLYTGKIKSIGPRYCPSIEDKIVRFGEREGHTLFLEPESTDYHEVYINGLATSLPFDVQIKIVRSIDGLKHAELIRPGYGIEYDYFHPVQLKSTLESKVVNNLFFAGQINGTSGYEEAAGQGIVAGINAANKLLGEEPFVAGREEAYIGVLIDDLVTKGTEEPYRMFTSRAEHRLLLRQDNSDERLMPIAKKMGYIEERVFESRQRIWEKKEEIRRTLSEIRITVNGVGKRAGELLKRPEVTFASIEERIGQKLSDDPRVAISIEADIKYSGFERKEKKSVELLKKIDAIKIPETIDYNAVNGVLTGSRRKLQEKRPTTLGQASRISGVTPSDISALAIYISSFRNGVSRETMGSTE